MNDNNTNKLITEFPKLYRQYNLPPEKSCMCWGFECGDGWFNVIYELSKELSKYNIEAVQVKEKFGGLRFYFDMLEGSENDHDKIVSLIREAEKKCDETCEVCGKDGKRVGGRWVRTLCEECGISR